MLAYSLSASSPVVTKSSPFGDIGGGRDRGIIRSFNFSGSARPCSTSSSRGLVLGSNGIGERDGLIIVDHGSRRKDSNLMLNEFVAMFRDRTGYPIVEPAHMDIPALTAEAAREYPGISYIITAPIGLHEQLVDVVNDRIKHCLSHVARVAEECSLCWNRQMQALLIEFIRNIKHNRVRFASSPQKFRPTYSVISVVT